MDGITRLGRRRASRLFVVTLAVATIACENASTIVGSFVTDEGGGAAATTGGASNHGGSDAGGAGADSAVAGAPPLGLEFEAEHGQLSEGFSVSRTSSEPATTYITATTPADLTDTPGEARAVYEFEVPASAEYVIYGRIHSPGVATNRFWFRVDEGDWTLWRISTGEEWFWDSLHENFDYGNAIVFGLEAGVHRLELGNAVLGAELDRFYIAPVGADAPENPGLTCNPPHSIQLDGQCVRSCGSYQTVSCGEQACAGKQEVFAYDCSICCLL